MKDILTTIILILGFYAINSWVTIENNKMHLGRATLLNQVCIKGGTYEEDSIKCK